MGEATPSKGLQRLLAYRNNTYIYPSLEGPWRRAIPVPVTVIIKLSSLIASFGVFFYVCVHPRGIIRVVSKIQTRAGSIDNPANVCPGINTT